MAATRQKKAAAPVPDTTATPGPVTLVLAADVGFAAARQLHADLLAVREVPEVVLDAAAVTRLSTAGVLVLVSFLNARETLTPPAAVISPPGAFVDAFSELGLFDKLMRLDFRT